MEQSRRHPSARDVKLTVWVGLVGGAAGMLLAIIIFWLFRHIASVVLLCLWGLSGSLLALILYVVGGVLLDLGEPFSMRFPVKRVIWGMGVYWFLFPASISVSFGWVISVPHSMAGVAVQLYIFQLVAMFWLSRFCCILTQRATQNKAATTVSRRGKKLRKK